MASDISELLLQQNDIKSKMEKFIRNFKKDPKTRKTFSYFQRRLKGLNEYWDKFKANDERLVLLSLKEEPYLKENMYGVVEEFFIESYALIEEEMKQSFPPVANEQVQDQYPHPPPLKEPVAELKLPLIRMPVFSGQYEDWCSFRDLFDSMIHKNDSLSAVQKLYYLKSQVSHEAEKLIKNFDITSDNYNIAWDTLKDRYENTKVLVNVQLKRLFSQPKITVDNAHNVKTLLDTTNECLAALKNLNIETENWDPILIYIIAQRLSHETLQLWEQHTTSKKELSTFKDLSSFLTCRFRALEAVKDQTRSTTKPPSQKSSCLAAKFGCKICNGDHIVSKCPNFIGKSSLEKLKVVKAKNLCFNCLSPFHNVRQCISKYSCNHCKKRHHSQLHEAIANNPKASSSKGYSNFSKENVSVDTITENEQTDLKGSDALEVSHVASKNQNKITILLSTALIKVSDSYGNEIVTRALLDQGSQSTFCSEYLAQRLKLKKNRIITKVVGIGNKEVNPSFETSSFAIRTLSSEVVVANVSALVLKHLTGYSQNLNVENQLWEHTKHLKLADPSFGKPGRIDLIIGADLYPLIFLDGCLKGPEYTPMAQNTKFGWILTGPINLNTNSRDSKLRVNMHSCTELSNQLRSFWEIEEIPRIKQLSKDDETCEKIFSETFEREQNRYTVQLPFKSNTPPLGETLQNAIVQFQRLENRLAKDCNLKNQYVQCLNEYLELHHMCKVEDNELELSKDELGYQGFYLPHHAVLKESSTTTKLRVVFNASQKSSTDISLNDKLFVGPNLQENLSAILHRWRTFKIAYTADIEKMYRQVRIADHHTNYQRIVWRKSPQDPIQHYKLLTVTFGMDCSAFLAIRTMRQLAEDEKQSFPLGAYSIENEFYVDNLMSGADTLNEALEKQRQTIRALDQGGFILRQWVSNESEILKNVSEKDRDKNMVKTITDPKIKTLGLYWNPESDELSYNTRFNLNTNLPTKRSVLSDISKLYDPLGWISPIIISGKILIQDLWLLGKDWDERIPPELEQKWLSLVQNIKDLTSIKIPRWIGLSNDIENTIEIHAFSDASIRAYAAALYVKTKKKGKNHTQLVFSKTKVAPIKPTSLPRLELCGALLAVNLIVSFLSETHMSAVMTYIWTDSCIVLAWVQGQPNRWKTFVANRVGEIHEKLPNACWRYVPSCQNPADIATREIKTQKLKDCKLWWQGPSWLSQDESHWPERKNFASTELEKRVVHSSQILNKFELLEKFSSFTKLIRITAWCLRFASNAKLHKEKRNFGHLTVKELNDALFYLIRIIQMEDFAKEIKSLKEQKPLHSKSKLLSLSPFLDKEGILRLGGRLHNATLPFSQKHPIILGSGNFSSLLLRKTHRETLHGGPQLVLGLVRRRYWILGAKRAIKKIIHECIQCWRQRPKTLEQQMGILPSPRVNISRAFTHSGVDYFGPIELKTDKKRKALTYKGYVSLFICLATKAIHLEVVSDMTTEAFLAAFRRFSARRGLCSDVYSDQGTNFKGAARILKDHFTTTLKSIEKKVSEILANDQVTWHFIPPSSPHFGGLWEAGVKSTKFHLKRILGNSKLTFEEMTTLLNQIEATLNSRPLCPLSDDPEDLEVLTPGHFLVGSVISLPPEPSILDISENRLNRWQKIQRLYQHFWSKWRTEYLSRLQSRPKWMQAKTNLAIGDLVIIKDYNLPPAKWLLARILKVHKGKDGLVRVVTLRTKDTVLMRPITKLCKLPFFI